MSVADPLIEGIRVTAAIMTMMAEADILADNERWIVHHLTERFGDKRGFKIAPLGEETVTTFGLECHEVCRKLVVAGYLIRPEYPNGVMGEHNWTDKCKEWRHASGPSESEHQPTQEADAGDGALAGPSVPPGQRSG